MKLSVAIATYNRASMVREAIGAALAQSAPPDEIVVSDDASTDGTAAMLEEIAHHVEIAFGNRPHLEIAGGNRLQVSGGGPHIRVLRQSVNTGGVENCNAAMRATRGDFIAWCSDDDRFAPDHLKASVEFLEQHPEIGMVHSSFIDSIEAGGRPERHARPLRSMKPVILNAVNASSLICYMIRYYDWPFHPSTLVMRRAVWQRTGEFDPAYALADTDWFVRAAAITNIAMLPRHGVINRRHPGNWSNRVGSANMQREIFEIVEKTLAAQPWLARVFWRVIWRANVRARLALTLRARLRSGHADAACAAWNAMLQHTGRSMPIWFEEIGGWLIRRWIARHTALSDARQSVSPL
jgi:glycosyltransferase involved in cell wall biosynthesis